MRLSWLPALFAAGSTLVHALPSAVANEEKRFEIGTLMSEIVDDSLHARDVAEFQTMLAKRDTTSTIENVLDLLNSSELIFDILDQVAYNPARISKLANYTADLFGKIDIGSLENMTQSLNIKLDINASAIYHEVMDSGVVTSLLDGILLDKTYQPVLANIISRLLEGNKNLLNYLIKNVFKSSKRDQIAKRDNSGTLEIFVGNVISTVLSSQLVGNLASDVLVALNETQFLTYTVKRLIADEGYQNMTAQFVLDLLATGSITLNAQAINITSIANKALSKPQVLVSLVSNLLSGKIQIPALGQYNTAVSSILRDVENNGVFADLNQYIFSESHSVTTPLLPTNQIVVPRTTSTTSTKKSSSTKKTAAATTSSFELIFNTASSAPKISFSLASTTKASKTSSKSSKASATGSANSALDQSSAEVASILAQLQGMSTDAAETQATETQATLSYDFGTTSQDSSASAGVGGLLGIIQALGGSSSTSMAKRAEASATNSANGAGINVPCGFGTRVLVLVQAALVGAVMLL